MALDSPGHGRARRRPAGDPPKEYGEAAEVFGATAFKRLIRVTLPMLKPALAVALLLRTVLAFEVFATVIAITGRGATVLTAEAWRWHTSLRDPNVAAAYAALILVLTVVAAALIQRIFVHHESR